MDAGRSGMSDAAVAPGTVVITPLAERSPSVLARLSSLTVGAGGLAVHVVAEVGGGHELRAERVWAVARHEERLLAFLADARVTRPRRVELSGVTAPVEERRRAHLRSPATLPVEVLTEDGAAPRRGSTVDISRGGFRVALDDEGSLEPGQRLQVRLGLETPATLGAYVRRLDPGTGHVVLRLTEVPPPVAAALDREVLGRLL